jgi:hypothetical protein
MVSFRSVSTRLLHLRAVPYFGYMPTPIPKDRPEIKAMRYFSTVRAEDQLSTSGDIV